MLILVAGYTTKHISCKKQVSLAVQNTTKLGKRNGKGKMSFRHTFVLQLPQTSTLPLCHHSKLITL